MRSYSDAAASQLSGPAATVAGKCRSHLHQVSDFDPQALSLRKFHPVVCKSKPRISINGILRLLRVSPTFLGFAAELICLDVRHRAASPRQNHTVAAACVSDMNFLSNTARRTLAARQITPTRSDRSKTETDIGRNFPSFDPNQLTQINLPTFGGEH